MTCLTMRMAWGMRAVLPLASVSKAMASNSCRTTASMRGRKLRSSEAVRASMTFLFSRLCRPPLGPLPPSKNCRALSPRSLWKPVGQSGAS